jgi:betaine-aldehyde dehydrogenase
MKEIKKTDYKMFINGEFVESSSNERFERISPSHDVVVGTYSKGNVEDTKKAIAAARLAFDKGAWPKWSGAKRGKALRKVAELIDANKEELALVETLESGKPISQAIGEMQSTAELWYYAATLAQHAYGDSHNAIGEDYLGIIVKEPIGVVGVITPWNFPLLIASQKVPYALAVGCTVVVKPSQLTPGTTVKLAEYVKAAGIPDGVVNIVTGFGEVGAEISENASVDMVTFTGSTGVGRIVMQAAAKSLKKVELELGGKNPQIIMDDADLDAAVDATVFGVYFNQGECCNSGSRILVQKGIAKEFTKRVVEKSKLVKVGDPLDPEVLVGSIASQAQLNTIKKYVNEGQESGAELLLGGVERTSSAGTYFEPTVFAGVKKDMSIAHEEIFGPVLSIIEIEDIEEAIEVANSTMFGLSSGIWTKDINQAVKFAKSSRSGTVWVNCWMDGFPEMSFGGYKESGIGRELGRHAIDEFTELKTIAIHTGERKMWVK